MEWVGEPDRKAIQPALHLSLLLAPNLQTLPGAERREGAECFLPGHLAPLGAADPSCNAFYSPVATALPVIDG